jgi:periplasmic copper chaperone A
MAKFIALAVAGIASAFIATNACAHATFETGIVEAGKTTKNVLRVPHGCGTQATHTVRIQIPEGVHSVKPMPKPGWTLTTTSGPYAEPALAGEKQISEGVREIIWSGGNLPNEHYDEFIFRSATSTGTAPGTELFFPAIQECSTDKVAWVEVPAPGQDAHALKMPAPGLKVAQGAPASGASPVAKPSIVTVGALSIEVPWTRATPAGAKVGGGYLKITNTGKEPDRLVGGSLPQAGRFEVHEMSVTDGVMKMRELAKGLEIRPGETVELKPGGFHLMFMDLKEPLKAGMALKGTLVFEKAGKVDVEYQVAPVGATAPGGAAGGHTHH